MKEFGDLDRIVQELGLTHLKATYALDLKIKEETLRKTVAEADTAEIVREHCRKAALMPDFPGFKAEKSS